MKRLFATFLIASVVGWAVPVPSLHAAFNPHFLATDQQLLDTGAMTKTQLQTFLQRGALADYTTTDHNGVRRSAADIIWNTATQFQINPQFLLVLLQREQSLVETDNPTQDQLDWAMGYGICDDCDKDDPGLTKFRGFGNQVYYAAKRIRESYLKDLVRNGHTISGIGPGIETVIDGTTVQPTNAATAVLYTYTPHLHGNANFVRIWKKWFTRHYPSGSLLKNAVDGSVWYIKHGQRHKVTSNSALYSRFDPRRIISVSPDMLDPYPEGSPISYPNYTLLRSPRGTVYLLVDDTLRGITSREAFRAIGFNPDEVIDVEMVEINKYPEGEPITVEMSHPRGRLMQNAKTGGVYYVKEAKKAPIMSREILKERFTHWPIESVSPEVLNEYKKTGPVPFPDGTLIAANGSPDVFIVAEGERRLIPNEQIFNAYDWQWDQIVWTDERSVLIHPLGEPIPPIGEQDVELALTK